VAGTMSQREEDCTTLYLQRNKMDIVQKCPHCQKAYFIIEGRNCPHCGKEEKVGLDIFKDIFGDDNPFSNIGVT
jgi:hypothetical protein